MVSVSLFWLIKAVAITLCAPNMHSLFETGDTQIPQLSCVCVFFRMGGLCLEDQAAFTGKVS